eukprot:Gregarina_sp_Poly_1__1459@NODE_1366_length_4286_cov_184_663901_g914_i0_p2_GENE_NODE_1366_length_4286_cov_184_663901_g914_i0NODE_1366_length_4286_cov_184_663901_g914_i0_p2_ORF_typecomplete_len382_score19_41_NODE_1366_length_4286_cov_184_663901_g914_i026463791
MESQTSYYASSSYPGVQPPHTQTPNAASYQTPVSSYNTFSFGDRPAVFNRYQSSFEHKRVDTGVPIAIPAVFSRKNPAETLNSHFSRIRPSLLPSLPPPSSSMGNKRFTMDGNYSSSNSTGTRSVIGEYETKVSYTPQESTATHSIASHYYESPGLPRVSMTIYSTDAFGRTSVRTQDTSEGTSMASMLPSLASSVAVPPFPANPQGRGSLLPTHVPDGTSSSNHTALVNSTRTLPNTTLYSTSSLAPEPALATKVSPVKSALESDITAPSWQSMYSSSNLLAPSVKQGGSNFYEGPISRSTVDSGVKSLTRELYEARSQLECSKKSLDLLIDILSVWLRSLPPKNARLVINDLLSLLTPQSGSEHCRVVRMRLEACADTI